MAFARTIPIPRTLHRVSAAPRARVAGRIEVVPARVATAMLSIVFLLTLASLAGQYVRFYLGHDYLFGLIQKFNLSHEGNIPTWYSSFSLLLCAALLGIIGHTRRAEGDRYYRHWFGLALLFLYISIDEGSAIHEMLNDPLRAALGASGFFYYPAAVVGLVFAAGIGFAYLSFLRSLPVRWRVLFVASAVFYLGGALVIESFSARHAEVYGQLNMTYAVITTLEELGEMLGIVLFVYTLLSYMADQLPPTTLYPVSANSKPS